MKKVFFALVSCFFLSPSWTSIYSVDSYTINLGFETGTFKGWTGYTWLYYGTDNGAVGTRTTPVQVTLPTARRQVIISDTTAYDANTGGALKEIPKGYRYSARLGDEIISSDGKPRGWEQSLQYKLKVDTTNSLLIIKFACVLQYASDHTALMEPRFKLTLYDNSGNTINSCTNYDVYSTSTTVKGFQTYTPSETVNPTPVKWRDWTTVGADLSAYKGQTITLELMAADCNGQYHFGYAYFVAGYQSMSITSQYCAGNDTATLTAPQGFESYTWKNARDSVAGTTQILKLLNPVDGSVYKCVLTSATGCIDSLKTTVWRYDPKAAFSTTPVACNDSIYKVQFNNLSTTNRGTLSYLWNFGDGTDTTTTPIHAFNTSGWHTVSLTVTTSSSACPDTKIDSVETFYPPLVGYAGDSTYCPGYTTTLKGYGADHYIWSYAGKTYKQDSLVIGTPGGLVTMTGYRSDNVCYATRHCNVIEEPYWAFNTSPDTLFCENDSAVLRANGAKTYIWSPGNSTNPVLVVKTPGTYTVTGINPRGCVKTGSIIVKEDLLPLTNFTVSRPTVDTRHNILTCTISPQTDVLYSWDMGDGLKETGSTVQHTYDITGIGSEYKVTLTATNKNGCFNSTTLSVDIVPFVPNVFTPNGDGINELFMNNYDLNVFDRYGTLLYKGTTGWDGKYKGKVMDNDSYFYLINYTDKNQKIRSLKGYVTLLK
jgi:gliding motility-associated-like protein